MGAEVQQLHRSQSRHHQAVAGHQSRSAICYSSAVNRSLAALPMLGLMLAGCARPGFHVRGELASEGDVLETWRWRPQGCIRAVQNNQTQAEQLASLLWIDPARRDATRAPGQQNSWKDAPVRLDLQRVNGEPVAILETIKTGGVEFNQENCRTLTLNTRERPPASGGRRGSLGGSLHLDCEVRGQHVTAQIEFEGCEY